MGSPEESQENEIPYLKNAWVRKDASGDYFLYIQTESGKSGILNLTSLNLSLDEQIKNEINPGKNDFIKDLFETWLAEQDRAPIKVEKSEDAELPDDEFPDVIDG